MPFAVPVTILCAENAFSREPLNEGNEMEYWMILLFQGIHMFEGSKEETPKG